MSTDPVGRNARPPIRMDSLLIEIFVVLSLTMLMGGAAACVCVSGESSEVRNLPNHKGEIAQIA